MLRIKDAKKCNALRGGRIIGGAIMMLAVIGLVPLSHEAYAEIGSSDVDFSLSVDATPSLEIVLAGDGLTTSPTSLGLNIKPNIDGTPVFGYSDLDVTVATSNATGYYLNFSTTNADGSLRTTSSSTLSTLADTGTFTCTTATASTCSFTTNRWGYKLAQDDATSYIAAPGSDGTKIDEIYTKTNGVTSNLRVGAKVDSSLTAGNYSTTMSFAATAHPTTYGVYYNYGAAEGTSPAPSGLPGNQSGALNNASTTTVTLSSSTPTWTGHTFNKWCFGTVTSTDYANDTCTGTEYSAGDSIVFDINGDVSVTLKAMWNINSYSIKYGTTTGIASVTLDGQTCTEAVSGTGCTKTLIYGKSYSLVATLNTGYSLSTWTATAGSVANNTTSTTYTVGAGNATIISSASLDSYTITITNSNTSSSVNSLTISYGGSATVTVTPDSNYYLSDVSCPSGYTCSGYSTDISYTGQQTVTVTNNGTTSGGTLSFTGALSMVNVGNMQNLPSSSCTTTAALATDNRDSQVYTIQRLADGKCWMMTNLNLGATDLTTDLTSSNTNLSTTITASAFNDWRKSSGSNTYTSAEYIPLTTSNTSTGRDTDPTSGTTYGTLYNYCAASAGIICTDSNSSDASYDLCPAGWRLPTGGSSGEFATLYANASYNTYDKMRASVANSGAAFALAGGFGSSKPSYQGNSGSYWSSTYSGTTGVSYLYLTTSRVFPSLNTGRNNGYSIRCILNETLYYAVAKQSKGTQTVAQLKESISASNSGVYTYNSSVFGAASDAASTSTIYYYRGILDNTTGSYGSNGDGAAYPNYVKLDNNTCWRILRTTGSGGVKMIYNGTWTGSTCANAQANAQLTTAPFNNSSATVAGTYYTGLQYQNMHAVGYTYSNVAAGTTSATALSTLFGSSGNDTTTNTNSSIIKKYIESWYSSNMTSYTSHLEANAGYCADRTTYPKNSYALGNILAESTTVIPYGTSSMTAYYYGAYTRNNNSAQTPTLGCPRGIVDIYSTTTASGGNGQLTYPVALITADEASFAGSGGFTAANGSSYNANSFLRSGSDFWLLSPSNRSSNGRAYVFYSTSYGYLYSNYDVNYSYGVRPAISLASGTMISGGSGTATDPWTVTW